MESNLDYWQLRDKVKNIIPRLHTLFPQTKNKRGLVHSKGRKKNYSEYDLLTGEMGKKERLLNVNEISSFAEISIRAAMCPMPLNMDVWDGLSCPYSCRMCFANYFRASLYTSFFDNSDKMGLRHCDPEKSMASVDELRAGKGTDDLVRAFRLRIPARFGIRFEDFLHTQSAEGGNGVSLRLLKYFRETVYPVMLNTRSPLVGTDAYVKELAENKSGAAVHITMLSTDPYWHKIIEPAAPTVAKRMEAAKHLTDAGVRVVARIEPFMVLVNDEKDRIDEYIGEMRKAGIRNVTCDTYSYSAYSEGIRNQFYQAGLDFDRMFLLDSDSQALGSLMLSKMMEYFQSQGISISTFDFGSIPLNSQHICCEVGNDVFPDAGFNWGNLLTAARLLREKGRMSWSQFCGVVDSHGGFLSESLKVTVHKMWNLDQQEAYTLQWVPGCEIAGEDEDGYIWAWNPKADDFRERLVEGLM